MSSIYKIITCVFIFGFSIVNNNILSSDLSNKSISIEELQSKSNFDNEKIKAQVPTWDELKSRDYDLSEFGLLENEKSVLFIKVFMAKIKYIKRHINDAGFIEKNNIPLVQQTQKIDEKKLIHNTKTEVLLLLGFTENDVLPDKFEKSSIFNSNKQ